MRHDASSMDRTSRTVGSSMLYMLYVHVDAQIVHVGIKFWIKRIPTSADAASRARSFTERSSIKGVSRKLVVTSALCPTTSALCPTFPESTATCGGQLLCNGSLTALLCCPCCCRWL